jgi:hypothetical protein
MKDDDEIQTYTVIPALPGWYVAHFGPADSEGAVSWEDHLFFEPIIAWEIERCEASTRRGERIVSHHAEPITLDGDMRDKGNRWAIKKPDGQCEIPYMATFENATRLLEYFQEQEKKRVAALIGPR